MRSPTPPPTTVAKSPSSSAPRSPPPTSPAPDWPTSRDLDRLTAFADNLVPHVLRLDGVLQLDPGLTARIEAGDLLEHGSPEEVELRAGAVHAVELLTDARRRGGDPLTPSDLDAALWNRGRGRRYKAIPRPRSRNKAY